nr:excinuclease ABC subunit UvrA [Bacillus wiedmannii]
MQNDQVISKMQKYYQSHSIITYPGDLGCLYDDLPSNIDDICRIVRGFLVNFEQADAYGINLTENRRDEINLRYVSKMLEKIIEKNDEALIVTREVNDRLVVTSRDFSVFLCSILRSKNIPARALCGFSKYQTNFHPSYWVCEYWDQQKQDWMLVDPTLSNTLHKESNNLSSRISSEQFYRSEEAWEKCRHGELDDKLFGYGNVSGLGFIRGNLIRNFASLNKFEVSPWDNLWGFRSKKDLRQVDYLQLDQISKSIAGGVNTFDELRTIFETDTALHASVKTKFNPTDAQGKSKNKEEIIQKNRKVIMNSNTGKIKSLNKLRQEVSAVELDRIVIEGARHHNLKNVNLSIPKNKLVVFTGVSGSGKSTLVFDTIFAEAQRRFVVGLSPYVRKYLDKVERPKLDSIYGLNPAIAIEQKSVSNNPRSTVGTITEISSYLRLLYSRVGIPECITCGTTIQPQTPRDIASSIYSYLSSNREFKLYAPILINSYIDNEYIFANIMKKGYKQVRINQELKNIDDIESLNIGKQVSIDLIGETFRIPNKEEGFRKDEFINELTKAIKILLDAAKQTLIIETDDNQCILFTTKLVCPNCHSGFPELSSQHFSFNTPLGMCPDCNGLGVRQNISPKLLVENPNLSILDGALRWFGNLREGNKTTWPTGPLDVVFNHYKLDIETPWKNLPEWFHNVIFYGSGKEKIKYQSTLGLRETLKPIKGLVPELSRLYYETESEITKKKYGSYMKTTPCSSCEGTRLCVEARSVKLGEKTISEVNALPINEALEWITNVYKNLDDTLIDIGEELIIEVYNRLSFLIDVGLHYLTINRTAPTLSGGEGQRVRLASQLSSGMVGVLYVLDEPSVGLHPKDIQSLLKTLLKLRDQGNSVIVVDHEEEIMRNADWLVDIGPKAGVLGGKVMSQGNPEYVMNDPNSLTGKYLSGELTVHAPSWHIKREVATEWLTLKGASQNNLNNVTANFPLGRFTCVTGLSGSGKSSLIGETLEPLLERLLNNSDVKPGSYEEIIGVEKLENVINVSQAPIGRTPRSNPATYTNLFNKIRRVFSNTKDAIDNWLSYDHFSFNSAKGRCEHCQGQGQVKVEMHFLADVWVTCNECKGKRFKPEVLAVKRKGKNISDVLNMDVNEAIEYFKEHKDIVRILQTFCDVGLDYIKLGQSATTLSGGEAQRVKLARELSKKAKGKMVYILDEPTTGLHFNDIQYLLNILHRLVDEGHTVIVIEHDLDVIKTADWIIELGPEGGKAGGDIIAQCSPEELIDIKESYTGQALKRLMKLTIN